MEKKSKKGSNNEKIRARIKPASEIDSYQRALIYGGTGQGKTRLASTAPNVLIIDVNEKGTSSTKRDTNPDVIPIEFWSELDDVFWFLQSGDHKYESYAIDGLTAARTLALNFVLGDEAQRDAARDPNMPTRQIHGKVGQLMRTMITNYRNLPMNGVFTAQTRVLGGGGEDDDDEGEPRMIAPDLPASVANHIEQAVNTIGYLTKRSVVVKKKGGTKRRVVRTRLITGLSDKYITKDRDRIFGEWIDSPDLKEMFKIANQEE